MPLSRSAYNRIMADPKRSEAARRGAETRKHNQRRREWAIKELMTENGGVWPEEADIEARIAVRRAREGQHNDGGES